MFRGPCPGKCVMILYPFAARLPSTSHPHLPGNERRQSVAPLDASNMRIRPPLSFASASNLGTTKGFKHSPLALLPPIPLYRRLLRTHRKHLPRDMRLLGDEYVKSEFRAHRNIENPVHIVCAVNAARTQIQLVNLVASVRSDS